MKIKLAEIVMGVTFIGIGIMGMGEKELFHYDVPIPFPDIFSTLCFTVGIMWLVVPAIIRSKKRNKD